MVGDCAGMLLRWFAYLYDMEIIEDEAFLNWREDVNDTYPGKGKALFQVSDFAKTSNVLVLELCPNLAGFRCDRR